ncbi:MAG: sulfate/molybdate ABC transporter ATP-binding protein [Fastidiosipilaceae bacterium]|nr:ATP-binding cassette domain-containing protein [Clostridiaceae bacterium]
MKLEVKITKRLKNFVLDVDFIHEQGVLGLLGHSGCGKSMTLKCLAGIETPDRGRIVLNDKVLFDSNLGINLKPRQRKVGYLFQRYVLFPNMTVRENILAGMLARQVEDKEQIVDSYIQHMYLQGLEDQYPYQLSGGEQQRVALARMLVTNPEVLLLDEPFSALDTFLKQQMEHAMFDLFDRYGGGVIYVTHNRDEINRFCDWVAVMEQGSVVELLSKRDLFERPVHLSTAKLSGCKNFSKATVVQKSGSIDEEHPSGGRVQALDWGTELTVSGILPAETNYIGVRAHYIQLSKEKTANSIPVRPVRVIENLFETSVICCPINIEFNSRPENIIQIDLEPRIWRSFNSMSQFWLKIDPEVIMPLQST